MTTPTKDEPLKEWLAKAAPDRIRTIWKSVSVERFMHVAYQALYLNPDLQKCSGFSVLNALVKCAQHNLEPDGRMAYLVPFAQNDKSGKLIRYNCVFILGYMGMVQICRRTGQIGDIQCEVVREGDEFDYQYGTEKFLRHRPFSGAGELGEIEHVWSLLSFTNGFKDFRVRDRNWIDWMRSRSKRPNKGPWQSDFEEMAKAKIFRQHFKWLPFSADVITQINDDEDVIDVESEPVVPGQLKRGRKPFASTEGFEDEGHQSSDPIQDESPPHPAEAKAQQSPDEGYQPGDESQDEQPANPPQGGLFK